MCAVDVFFRLLRLTQAEHTHHVGKYYCKADLLFGLDLVKYVKLFYI